MACSICGGMGHNRSTCKSKSSKNSKLEPRRIYNQLCEMDFEYFTGIECDYDEYHPCHHGSDCCDGDYCRCGEIRNVTIKVDDVYGFSTDLASRINDPYAPIATNKIKEYGIQRLSVIHKLWDSEAFDGRIGGGYYGDELKGINLEDRVFMNDVQMFFELKTDAERMRFLLMKEYGHLLPELEKCSFGVCEAPLASIKRPQRGYAKKVDLKEDPYVGYTGIYGLCRAQGGFFHLIDGYHRIASAHKQGLASVWVILAGPAT